MATINRKTRTFSDLNLLFTTNPVTADVTKKFDEEAVKASVRNLVQTKNFERLFHPEIGCQVYSMLFENITPQTLSVIEQTVFDVINKFEPRVVVLDVKPQQVSDENSLNIDIVFRIINSDQPITVTASVQRVR
jgi:phage baseplate assembly protein W